MSLRDEWRAKYRIQLDTPRLLLRPLIESDADWLTELLCDLEVSQFLWDGASDQAEARGAAEAIVDLDLWQCRFGHWAILDRSTAAIHGWVELSKLRPWDLPSDEIALSYVLRRNSWGQGIATEAAGRLLQCAFELHGLDRVMAVIMSGNLASWRVLEKLDMRLVKKTQLPDGNELTYFIRTAASPPGPPA